ncbi:FAD-dependent thymidylate synthase [Bacillus chungangensis]|nr:FAD-dependent thymidylate synthase [Bacillus chungangensis]
MGVCLLAHTQLSMEFIEQLFKDDAIPSDLLESMAEYTSGQAAALTAIRSCYSPNKPSEIVAKEGERYFGSKATDGKAGTETDRLIRLIVASGHTSTLEHLTFTFAIEGVSRALLAQLTRHRVGFSFSVQSQRYVRMGTSDKTGGFDYVLPESIKEKPAGKAFFETAMRDAQEHYDVLREIGIPPEDARAVLPNAAACNLVLTANLRSLLDFYSKRRKGMGAQHEITVLAERLKSAVVGVEPWAEQLFEKGYV